MDLTDPVTRWGVGMGLVSGFIIAAVALLFLEGTLQYLVLGIAVLDVVTTPWILKRAADAENENEDATEAEHAG